MLAAAQRGRHRGGGRAQEEAPCSRLPSRYNRRPFVPCPGGSCLPAPDYIQQCAPARRRKQKREVKKKYLFLFFHNFRAVRDGHLFSAYLMMPLAATTLALLVFNWYPSQVGGHGLGGWASPPPCIHRQLFGARQPGRLLHATPTELTTPPHLPHTHSSSSSSKFGCSIGVGGARGRALSKNDPVSWSICGPHPTHTSNPLTHTCTRPAGVCG